MLLLGNFYFNVYGKIGEMKMQIFGFETENHKKFAFAAVLHYF